MSRTLSWTAAVLSGLLALGSGAALTVAALERDAAGTALRGSIRSREAERSVVRAQGRLTGADVGEALDSIRRANEAADRVAGLTRRLVGLLEATLAETTGAVEASREGASRTVTARRETDLAAQLLAAIAGYQASASDSAAATNRALRRILEALRATNREFPGPGGGAP